MQRRCCVTPVVRGSPPPVVASAALGPTVARASSRTPGVVGEPSRTGRLLPEPRSASALVKPVAGTTRGRLHQHGKGEVQRSREKPSGFLDAKGLRATRTMSFVRSRTPEQGREQMNPTSEGSNNTTPIRTPWSTSEGISLMEGVTGMTFSWLAPATPRRGT